MSFYTKLFNLRTAQYNTKYDVIDSTMTIAEESNLLAVDFRCILVPTVIVLRESMNKNGE